jgi:hypothetical protein
MYHHHHRQQQQPRVSGSGDDDNVFSVKERGARKTSFRLYFREAGVWMDRGMHFEHISDEKAVALACYLRARAIYRFGLLQLPTEHARAVQDVVGLELQLRKRIVGMLDVMDTGEARGTSCRKHTQTPIKNH